MKTIGVLNLQGAVSEHITMLKKLDTVKYSLVKKPQDLQGLDGLIIPGGESTAISRLINQNGLFEPIKQFSRSGKGIFGTCAGLVLCAKTTTKIDNTDKSVTPLGLIDLVVERNGFGRQIDSFETRLTVNNIGDNIPAIFIRAPYIQSFSQSVTPLAYIDQYCVMAQSKNILICSFHPELTDDLRIIHYFIKHCC
ncbi:pyridoxal phosphate synthase yaaE subunit [Orbus hercynius]|uniref:Pyridoxal 5'-phosphate synthase subunit PdxT n=1 Tax=Orbus hercynius TaxID=593135 RepID=A0A495RCB2_9GAMM|nr:pyridoxal 5'-phosphate synthase glutaminase subunit PdxT [Orbus hercynius]RKS85103.1 pyridoxal phosphate synthase yaaE subunit [Orbus hercynius]